jgi:hypothetical protein
MNLFGSTALPVRAVGHEIDDGGKGPLQTHTDIPHTRELCGGFTPWEYLYDREREPGEEDDERIATELVDLFGEQLRMNPLIGEMNEGEDVETEQQIGAQSRPQQDIEGVVPDASPRRGRRGGDIGDITPTVCLIWGTTEPWSGERKDTVEKTDGPERQLLLWRDLNASMRRVTRLIKFPCSDSCPTNTGDRKSGCKIALKGAQGCMITRGTHEIADCREYVRQSDVDHNPRNMSSCDDPTEEYHHKCDATKAQRNRTRDDKMSDSHSCCCAPPREALFSYHPCFSFTRRGFVWGCHTAFFLRVSLILCGCSNRDVVPAAMGLSLAPSPCNKVLWRIPY